MPPKEISQKKSKESIKEENVEDVEGVKGVEIIIDDGEVKSKTESKEERKKEENTSQGNKKEDEKKDEKKDKKKDKEEDENEDEDKKEPEKEKEPKNGSNSNGGTEEPPISSRMDSMHITMVTSKIYELPDRQSNDGSIQEESKSKKKDMEPIIHGQDSMLLMERSKPNLSSINEENKEEVSRSQLGSMAEIVECGECHNITTEELKVLNGRDVCDSCYTRLNRKQNDD